MFTTSMDLAPTSRAVRCSELLVIGHPGSAAVEVALHPQTLPVLQLFLHMALGVPGCKPRELPQR